MTKTGHQGSSPDSTEMNISRVEALSDGVFAVAATLLVLNIQVPHLSPTHAAEVINGLLSQWPSYLSYFITFMSLGTVWIGHHRVFKFVRSVDPTLQLLNIIFLMFITLMPFTTAFFAEYIQQSETIRLASIIYNSHWVILGLFMIGLWRYARRANLLKPNIEPARVKEISSTFGTRGVVSASLIIVLALFAPELSVLASLLITLIYMQPLLHIFRPTSPRKH
jgi:uncharacterized membrane protein